MHRPTLLAGILLTALLAGCAEPGFEWQDIQPPSCEPGGNSTLDCVEIASGYKQPTWVEVDASGRIWLSQQEGLIHLLNPTNLSSSRIVGNLTDLVTTCHLEQGLLGFALPPESLDRILLAYTAQPDRDDCGRAFEGRFNKGDLELEDANELLRIPEPYRNHNGGHLRFGPDGLLYLAVGDGGDHGDPLRTGQDGTDLLGSILRYRYEPGALIPAGNQDADLNPAVLVYGVRNPWRFDFEPDQGRLWVADVGQNCYEEVNVVPLDQVSNLGWSTREGSHRYEDTRSSCSHTAYAAASTRYMDPVWEYPHESGLCSITGGFWMDWGPQATRGGYLVGDFCVGRIWSVQPDQEAWRGVPIAATGTQITSFARGPDDALWLLSWGGSIFELRDAVPAA